MTHHDTIVISDPMPQERAQELACKVLWEMQLRLRKFVQTAERIFENEVWRDQVPQETINWLAEWYPQVKGWLAELKLLEGKVESPHPLSPDGWADFLQEASRQPGLGRLLDSAPEKLPQNLDDDTLGYSVAHALLRLTSLRRDIQSCNYARIWYAHY